MRSGSSGKVGIGPKSQEENIGGTQLEVLSGNLPESASGLSLTISFCYEPKNVSIQD
jgi:hypothetical protein